jgi:hypothetical protein
LDFTTFLPHVPTERLELVEDEAEGLQKERIPQDIFIISESKTRSGMGIPFFVRSIIKSNNAEHESAKVQTAGSVT